MELLRTPRLALRSWTDRDAPAFLDIYGRDEVVRWLGTQPRRVTVTTLEGARERIRSRAAGVADLLPPMGRWGIVPVESGRDEPIGTVLLMPLEDEAGPTDLVEIGWHLHPDWQGRGYATEASLAVLERAATAGIEEVIALIDLDNERSQRVAVRVGMTDEGLTDRWYGLTLRDYRKVLGAAGP